MQEKRYDGSVVLTDRATQEQILAALGDPSNQVVALHKPGSAVTLPDGREYVCQADGSWVKPRNVRSPHGAPRAPRREPQAA